MSLAAANEFAHFAAIRLQVYPTAIGLMPPDFFVSAIRLPPKRTGLTAEGHLPSSKQLTNAVIEERRLEPCSLQLIRSMIC